MTRPGKRFSFSIRKTGSGFCRKRLRSRLSHQVAEARKFGAGDQTSPKSVAQRRGKKIADLMARREGLGAAEAEAQAEAVVE